MKAKKEHKAPNVCEMIVEMNNTHFYFGATASELVIDRRIELFNSALASHVQSELSTKIAEIEKTFTDEWIKEWSSDEACEADGGENKRLAFFISVGANKLRSEILKLLKGE